MIAQLECFIVSFVKNKVIFNTSFRASVGLLEKKIIIYLSVTKDSICYNYINKTKRID